MFATSALVHGYADRQVADGEIMNAGWKRTADSARSGADLSEIVSGQSAAL